MPFSKILPSPHHADFCLLLCTCIQHAVGLTNIRAHLITRTSSNGREEVREAVRVPGN